MKVKLIYFLFVSLLFIQSNTSSNLKKTPLAETKNNVENTRILQNLRAFTKLYGYVKYFHPSDEASKIDWDIFAIYGSKKIKKAQNTLQLKNILNELFLPIAPTIQIYNSNEKPNTIIQKFPKDTSGLKTVAWQHLGVNLKGKSSVYKSIRINRENKFSKGNNRYRFGTITQSIDAKNIRGKEVKLKALVKTNVKGSGNQGQLWLRVDRENKQVGFFDNMDDRPIKSERWKEFEITGKVNNDAKKIVFGCFLSGYGKVWIDEFQLLVKDKEHEWKTIKISNSGFEEEDVNKKPKEWSFNSPGYTYRLSNDNSFKGKNSLLIEREKEYEIITEKLFDKYPKISEVVSKDLGSGLSCQIPLALYTDSNGTLGQVDKISFDKLLEQLNKLETTKLTANNEFVRLGNVINTWNIFQHFYPYFDVVNTDWDVELTNSLNQVLTNRNEADFYYTLKNLIAKLHDGHGRVSHNLMRKQAGFPFLVDWIENKVVVIESEDTKNFRIGDVIISIEGTNAEQALIDAEQYISGSPQWRRVNSLRRFGYGKEGTTVNFKVMRKDKILELDAIRNYKKFLIEKRRPSLEEIENNIFYVNLDKAKMAEITEKMNELANAKGIIFDLRGYPKGNHAIISHLLTEPDTSSAWMRVSHTIYPDQENIVGFSKYGWHVQPKEPHIKGKVVFLTDGRAISYAESFMGFIEHYNLAEIVGQPTAGANGNVNPIELPGGFRISWTGMKVLKHDGSQHHLIGIQPTVPVQRTIKGVIEGKDEFLEKALEIIKKN